MNGIRELVDLLAGRLAKLGYASTDTAVGDVECTAVFATPRQSTRLVCAVIDLRGSVAGIEEAERLVGDIRRGLSKRYPGFLRPKRLGTFTVLLADGELCARLRGHRTRLIDSHGRHVNVLLGTVLVDVERFRTHADTIWGLIDTGDQFKRIQDAVESWCAGYREPRRLFQTRGRALRVA